MSQSALLCKQIYELQSWEDGQRSQSSTLEWDFLLYSLSRKKKEKGGVGGGVGK